MKNTEHRICPSCGTINRVSQTRELGDARCAKCKARLTSAEPLNISAEIAAKLVDRDGGNFVFDFWADWCGPCHQLAPNYQAAAEQFGGGMRFFKVNADKAQELGRRLGVRGIPALFLFRQGDLVSQKAGALPAQTLVSWISGELGVSAQNGRSK